MIKSLFVSPLSLKLTTTIIVLNSVVAVATIILFGFLLEPNYEFHWASLYEYRYILLKGFCVTVAVSIFALVLSLILGMLLALAQRSPIVLVRMFARIFVEVHRGTPLLVQILFGYYVIADALGIENRYLVGVYVLSMFEGAYLSEIIRGGIESIGKTQTETAVTIGLTPTQTYRYVIIPQLIQRLVPSIVGQFTSIIKDSSLLYVISINEFTMSAIQVNNFTYATLEAYFILALGYFAVTLPISLYSRRIERKFSYET